MNGYEMRKMNRYEKRRKRKERREGFKTFCFLFILGLVMSFANWFIDGYLSTIM